MTNEMQLAQAAGLPVVSHEMATGQPPNQPGKPAGLKKIHRLLRGRYPLVITLGLLFGIAGGLTGFLSTQPIYTSTFTVEIVPQVQTPGSYTGEMIPGYTLFLQSQVAVLKSYDVVQRALDEDAWKATGAPRGDEAAIAHFAAGVEAENNPPDTSMLRISYSDPDKNLALAGAQSVLKAYQEFCADSDQSLYPQKLQELQRQQTKYSNDLASYAQSLRELQSQYNTDDLASYQSENMRHLGDLSSRLDDAKTRLDIDQKIMGVNQPGGPAGGGATTQFSPLTEDQIATFDGGKLNQMRGQRDLIETEIERMKANGYGDAAPRMQNLHADLSVADQEIAAYVQSFSQGYRIDPEGSRPGLTSIRAEIVALGVEIDDLTTQLEHQKALCADVGKYSQFIRDVKANMAHAQQGLDDANAEYERLQSMRDLNGNNQMRVISNPIAPTGASTDKRKVMGAMGFLGGGLLPMLVVMAVSLLDGRFRYSDEANSDLGGIPLLGILPNLPDLLTDPSQAATAAHCVHQIRTILQITGHPTEKRVFTITSASPGDGKTSLTLALGLSFAASGSRTLLVDGDMIGGGLTARLNVNAEHGVLEAMAARDITPFIRTTDVADLSFLPVGKAMGGYTGTISPAAVRRLVDEARKQFDVILVDTGPILGSIEASPVAVASDGVVLCVSRGQQRQLVDRALAHLHAIGARLAGVVFNRAQAHDFERSTNRLGLGSIPAGTDGRRNEAIGPVARAVASSVRSAASGQDH
ncbi:MAG: AAA family ATPase [Tepidisphaeraceae bacterium]|jgi:capsular exopolysaccharide synthesis family protein